MSSEDRASEPAAGSLVSRMLSGVGAPITLSSGPADAGDGEGRGSAAGAVDTASAMDEGAAAWAFKVASGNEVTAPAAWALGEDSGVSEAEAGFTVGSPAELAMRP